MTITSDTSVAWEDYARAEQFLPWNAYGLAFNVLVRPNWVGESDRFWYLNRTRHGKEFVLVDPERGARELAFDHVRLAAALSLATGRPYEPDKLPFNAFEFIEEGRAIQFDLFDAQVDDVLHLISQIPGSDKVLSAVKDGIPDLVKILREMDAVARKGIILQQLKEAGVLDATALQLPAEIARWAEGRRWVCDLDTYQCTEMEPETTAFPGELLSPDGRWAAFVKGDNLYVRSIATGKEIALTGDGEPYYNYATSPESNTHTVTDRLAGRPLPPIAIWSPDSKKLFTHKLDQRNVAEMHLVQSAPPDGSVRPVLHSYRYPLPGDENVASAEFVILDVEAQTKQVVEYEPQLVFFLSPIEYKWAWWSQDSQHVFFLYLERGWKALRVCEVAAQTGAARTILKERGPTNVEPNLLLSDHPNVRTFEDSSEIIWYSQRDGWAHLYLFDRENGALKNQITSGAWVVRDILHVDEKARQVTFTAGGREEGRDPYYRHLYRIGLDGKGLQLLTPEDADHEIKFAPTGNYFIDTYSRVDAAPVTVLRAADGRLVCKLEEADVELLLATGWQWPERFSVKAHDGVTDLYGVIYHPSHFDPQSKYPVLDAIYPGPQVIRTPKSFPLAPLSARGYWEPQTLAELGFVVVTIDGLGTPLRSKAFHDYSYGNFAQAGSLQDHIVGLRQLASRHSYMDLSRVGIYGHSGGGFASARAILLYPDFYKVAVSSAGNHDQRGYCADWGEKYQGLLDGDNYLDQVTASLAANLKGKLLLVYGDMDDNVPPALTIQLVDALIKANKDFDLLVLPNRNHTFAIDPYFIRKKWDYLVQHLLGQTPPQGYQIKGIDPALLASLMEEARKDS